MNKIFLSIFFITFAQKTWAHPTQALRHTDLATSLQQTLGKLDEKQRKKIVFAFDSASKKEWHFVPMSRQGLALNDMTPAQRGYVLDTLKNFLSANGYTTIETIRDLEKILKQEEFGFNRRDPLGYFLEVFGEPRPDGAWALSFEGHHLSLNFVIQNNNVVSFSPMFFGANPAEVRKDYKVGPPKGTRPMALLEDSAFKLLQSLSPLQKKEVVLSSEALGDVVGASAEHAPTFPKKGLSAERLNSNQREILKATIEAFLSMINPKHVKNFTPTYDEKFFSQTNFAWHGSGSPGQGHYFRIDSSRFLIEVANAQSDVSGNPANHIHALWMSRPPQRR